MPEKKHMNGWFVYKIQIFDKKNTITTKLFIYNVLQLTKWIEKKGAREITNGIFIVRTLSGKKIIGLNVNVPALIKCIAYGKCESILLQLIKLQLFAPKIKTLSRFQECSSKCLKSKGMRS